MVSCASALWEGTRDCHAQSVNSSHISPSVSGRHLQTGELCVDRRQLKCLSTSARHAAPESEPPHKGSTFQYAQLKEQLVSVRGPSASNTSNSTFGHSFTDHMLVIEHVDETGWGAPLIKPFGPLSVHPCAPGIHYGISCFEGMKAYMGPSGQGLLFRPDMNMARFERSCKRLCLASFDTSELLKCIKHLLRTDKSYLPNLPGHSLYIRPFSYASSHSLGVTKPTRTTLSVIVSPVGPYFTSGLQPIAIYIDESHVRAWPGGMGSVKAAGNYAPTVLLQENARELYGCAQVLYVLPSQSDPLDARVSECGTMNMFFLLKTDGGSLELITPPLDDTLLPGVTRDTVLRVTGGYDNISVSERHLTIRELRLAAKSGMLLEAFGTGTACAIQPVTVFKRSGNGMAIEEFSTVHTPDHPNSLATHIKCDLEALQTGRVDSEWSVQFD